MNIEYILYKDKDIIVSDEKGNKRIIEYQDNIQELLTQENLVEVLENELVDLEKQITKTESIKKNKKGAIPLPLYGGISGFAASSVLVDYLTNGEKVILETVLGPTTINQITALTFGALFLPYCGILSTVIYHDYKDYQKEENGLQAKLSALKQILSKEKEILAELKNAKTDGKNDIDEEFKCVRIEEPEKLYLLREDLRLYYDCGYNERKYLKFYDKGILSTKLQKSYYPHRIKLAEEYLEEKRKVKSLNKRCN